jgi:hypothetical protein
VGEISARATIATVALRSVGKSSERSPLLRSRRYVTWLVREDEDERAVPTFTASVTWHVLAASPDVAAFATLSVLSDMPPILALVM